MSQRSVGTKIMIGAVAIAELTSIDGLKLSADTIDSTALDSQGGYRTFQTGFKDGGEVAIEGYFNPSDTGQTSVYAAFDVGSTDTYQILFPSAMGASWTFGGVVTAFETGVQLEDLISFSATIKVSGKPTFGTTASANLTALSLTGTAGALAPAFAGATYAYAYSFTGTNLTITPTLAGATFDLYVDDVIYQKGITSAGASNVITFSAVGTKKLTLIYNEAGKVSKSYTVVGNRTA
jgi:predicted secreted protein